MDKEKVDIIRTRQMLNKVENYLPISKPKFPTHFDLQVDENMKRRINKTTFPIEVEKLWKPESVLSKRY